MNFDAHLKITRENGFATDTKYLEPYLETLKNSNKKNIWLEPMMYGIGLDRYVICPFIAHKVMNGQKVLILTHAALKRNIQQMLSMKENNEHIMVISYQKFYSMRKNRDLYCGDEFDRFNFVLFHENHHRPTSKILQACYKFREEKDIPALTIGKNKNQSIIENAKRKRNRNTQNNQVL